MRRLLLPLLSAFLLAPALRAQSGRGDLSGVVLFAGTPPPGAVTVQLIDPETGALAHQTVVDADDPYRPYELRQVPAGNYVVRYSAPGHRCYDAHLHIGSDFHTRLAIVLHPAPPEPELPPDPGGPPEPCSHGGF